MAANCRGVVITEGDLQRFVKHLEAFAEGQLRRVTEYFHPDLIYVIENDIALVVQELRSRKVITPEQAQIYEKIEKHEDSTAAAEKLVADLASNKALAIGLWKSLCALRRHWSHPNLEVMVGEITRKDQALLKEILLNETGHNLAPEMKACQDEHRRILLEQTKLLKETGQRTRSEGQSFPILNRYVDIKIVADVYFRRQTFQEHEALAAAGELNEYRLRHKMQVELERITPDRLFRWCYRSGRAPHFVMVSGVAGVGKSTLAQKFVFDWATGKHYQKFTFVFFFKFRDLNAVGEKTSLESLIQREYPYLHSKLDTILQEPQKLLFIFDGLDESNSNLDLGRKAEFCAQPGDVKPVGVIVASLLKEKLLKGCSALLTSRPSNLARLERGVLHRVASIVGFLSQEREKYFHNFFGEAAVAKEALAHVRESQVLYTLCYNPSYCWITCTALQPCFTSEAGQTHPLPKTVTQLFVSYIRHVMVNHTKELPERERAWKMMIQLGWLAEYGLQHRTLLFDQAQLEAFNVDSSPLVKTFLVENIQSATSTPVVTYSFVHLTVQEFFAALVHYLDFKEGNFGYIMAAVQEAQGGEYEIFLRFLSGLSQFATRAPLEALLGKFSAETARQVIDWILKTDCSDFLQMERPLDGKKRTLNFLNLLFEAHNKLLVCEALGGDGDASMDFSELYLMPVDCVILAYVLSCCGKIDLLNLDTCFIQNEGLQRLSLELHRIRELRLCNNDLSNPSTKELVSILKHKECRLEILSLAKNALTGQCCKDLSLALLENWTLLNLDLSKNKLQDQGLSDLLKVFRSPESRIQKLVIQENALSDGSFEALCSALADNTSLRYLDVSGNPFTDMCAEDVHTLILTCPALTEIRLNLSDISPAMEKDLKKLDGCREGFKIHI
uniref:NACHT, LRR and PYD domains-containing protein 12-like n=1 Tax=Podarcis muralis TaxID=64176 RepID=A0A670JJ82_PODMU|nr:NACHT, LRR and PYD domains-containing protein 12-like [Podarcis muralis]